MQALFEILTDLEIFVKFVGVVVAGGIPLRTPVLGNGETKRDRIDFLAHDLVFVKGWESGIIRFLQQRLLQQLLLF